MAKTKKPSSKSGKKKAAPPPMRRKSKRAINSALPHVDVTAPKRKPIPAQVADGELRTVVTLKGRRYGLSTAAAKHRLNPRATAFPPEHPTVEEQFEAEARALPKTPTPKPGFWHRFRSAITGLFVPKAYAKAHPDTTVREKASK